MADLTTRLEKAIDSVKENLVYLVPLVGWIKELDGIDNAFANQRSSESLRRANRLKASTFLTHGLYALSVTSLLVMGVLNLERRYDSLQNRPGYQGNLSDNTGLENSIGRTNLESQVYKINSFGQ